MGIKLSLTIQIWLGMLVGIVIGLIGGQKIAGIQIIGAIFLKLIQMAVIPLVFLSIISSVGTLTLTKLKQIGVKTLLWFLTTTVIAAIIGGFIGNLGKFNLSGTNSSSPLIKTNAKSLSDTIMDFFPNNLFAALSNGQIIQITIFALCFRVALSRLNHTHKHDTLLNEINKIIQLLVEIINVVLIISPIGISALMIGVVANHGLRVIGPLLKFIVGYGLTSSLFLLLLFIICAWRLKISLLKLIANCSQILMVSATTSSSAASMPIVMHDADHKLGIAQPIRELVLTLGMTLNSNGLSMYLAFACVVLAQVNGLAINFAFMAKIIIIATIACLGTVIVPGSGLVALAIVIPPLGIPVSGIAIIAGTEWILGIFRTVLNVLGDITTALMIAKDDNQIELKGFNH